MFKAGDRVCLKAHPEIEGIVTSELSELPGVMPYLWVDWPWSPRNNDGAHWGSATDFSKIQLVKPKEATYQLGDRVTYANGRRFIVLHDNLVNTDRVVKHERPLYRTVVPGKD